MMVDLKSRLRQLTDYGMLNLPEPDRSDPRGRMHGEPEGFEALETPAGTAWVRSTSYDADHVQGRVCFDAFGSIPPEVLSIISGPGPCPSDWSDLLFLDTETTGLSMGTGTHVFLVGLANLSDEGVQIRQYLMKDPAGEMAFLDAVARDLHRFDHLATFNGKRFDMPLLSQRFTMQRMKDVPDFTSHHDLLYPARRLWRKVLASCSLSSLEQNRLGFCRRDDIPGSQVPQRYFLFLEDGDADHLSPIIRHNTLDLLSSMALAVHIGCICGDPTLAAQPEEALAVAHLARRAKRGSDAEIYFTRALELAQGLSSYLKAAEELSLWLKRRDRWREAVQLWKGMIDRVEEAESALLAPTFPYEELAKYYEHREHDFTTALEYTERSLSLVRHRARRLGSAPQRVLADLEHRRQRLLRRLTTA